MSHRNCKHTVEYPDVSGSFKIHFVNDRLTESFSYRNFDYSTNESGILIAYFDKFRNINKTRIIPWHQIREVEDFLLTSYDDALIEQWYAAAHNGLSPDEEEEMRMNERVRLAMGIRPDEDGPEINFFNL